MAIAAYPVSPGDNVSVFATNLDAAGVLKALYFMADWVEANIEIARIFQEVNNDEPNKEPDK